MRQSVGMRVPVFFNRIFWRNSFVFLFILLGMLCIQAIADDIVPQPSTGTLADYYVSWDHGDDDNPGTIEQPFKTPDRAVSMLRAMPDPSGKVILIRQGWYRWRDHEGNRLFLKGLHGSPGAPIQIRGYPGETVILDAFTEPFNPLAVPFRMNCGWGGVSINESSYLTVENLWVCGRRQCNVEILNSDWITIRYIISCRSDKHGLFTGGSFHHLVIECCRFYEQMYGSTSSHGIYISGGHWDPELPPVRYVWIRYCECYYNGRHGIQLNGRIENVAIDHCNIHHNVLGGISLIGVRNATINRNLIYKNNKQGVILYTYFDDDYWDINDPDSVAHWKLTHWPIENIHVDHNTIYMDDIPWYIDEWTSYNPTYHAGILIVDTSGLLPP
ncbi:MAG: right-handed parallel beta-helix repeat-containing protein, partial [Planctomycetes bacterium]|nr:right-handed parallel beta-helix repeat-containing protein [Planctomycetota bacterium]